MQDESPTGAEWPVALPFRPYPTKCLISYGPGSTSIFRRWPGPRGCGGGLCPAGVCNVDADGDCLVTLHEVIPIGSLTPDFAAAERPAAGAAEARPGLKAY